MTKIKAYQIKPGMLINRAKEDKRFLELVTAVDGFDPIEYIHFQTNDGYSGSMIRSVDRNEEVEVIEGELKREAVQKCLEATFRRQREVENDINTIKLIQAMGGDK